MNWLNYYNVRYFKINEDGLTKNSKCQFMTFFQVVKCETLSHLIGHCSFNCKATTDMINPRYSLSTPMPVTKILVTFHLRQRKRQAVKYNCRLGIQIRKSKIDLNILALSIGCRNKHWSQCFNQILISSTGLITPGPAVVVQAALESRAACTRTARPGVIKPFNEIIIWLEYSDQCMILQPMLSATIFKSIFDFRICIPNAQSDNFKGGLHNPSNCTARHKVAILIPYR